MYIGLASELIKKHEGLRLQPYKCTAGKLTIGYGRNIEDNGISVYEAEVMLENDIQKCYALCIKFPFWNNLNEVRQSVILDMCYNLGFTRLQGFKKMLKALEIQDYKSAAKEMLDSKWARDVKSRATELAELMTYGYQKEK